MRTPILIAAALIVVGSGVVLVTRSDPEDPMTEDDADATDTKARGGNGRRAPREDKGPRGRTREETGDTALEARVAKLEREMKVLRRQLALGRGATAGGPDLVEQLDDPRLDSTVRDIVADERERQRSERWQRRSERALERLAETVTLTEDQQTAIAALWETEREQIGPLFMEARRGERDFDEVIEEVEAARASTDAEVGKLLSADQLEAYLENRPRGPGGRGRGGEGGRGRGDGRAGVGPREGR